MAASFVSSSTVQIWSFLLINVLLAQSINLLTGVARQISLGHAGFLGLGAYGSALLMKTLGLPLPLTLALATLLGAAGGWLLSFAAGRVREFYLAMMTLGFGMIFYEVAREWSSLTGGVVGLSGVPSPTLRNLTLFGWRLDAVAYFQIMLGVVALVALARGIVDEAGFEDARIRVADDGSRIVPVVPDPPLRQIIVPTTLSGAEFSNLGGCTDPARQVKDIYTGRFIGGQAVILDPAVTVHTPDRLWLSTGIRAVDHAVETVCSRRPNPFTDATCLHALTMLARSLRANREAPGDMEARLDSQLGVWLASTGLGRVEWGASHGTGHQLGAVAGVPHGHCSCVMLPSVLRWNHGVNADRQALVAKALGRDDGDAAAAVADLVRDLGQPGDLRSVGVRRDHFDAVARGAMQNMMVRSNPRPVTSEAQVHDILELAW